MTRTLHFQRCVEDLAADLECFNQELVNRDRQTSLQKVVARASTDQRSWLCADLLTC